MNAVQSLNTRLKELIEPDLGLIDRLHSDGALDRGECALIRSERTIYEQNGKLVEFLNTDEKCTKFFNALSATEQQHVVNFILANGAVNEADGDCRPLDESYLENLRANLPLLLDKLQPETGLVARLFSIKCITNVQKEVIMETSLTYVKSQKLLDFMTRKSVAHLKQFADCLCLEGQGHLKNFVLPKGVIAQIDAHGLSADQRQIIRQFGDMMTNPLLQKQTIIELSSILPSAGKQFVIEWLIHMDSTNSISLFLDCVSMEGLQQLREMCLTGELKTIFEILFTFLSGDKQPVRIETVQWKQYDYDRCLTYLSKLQDKSISLTVPEFDLSKDQEQEEEPRGKEEVETFKEDSLRDNEMTLEDNYFRIVELENRVKELTLMVSSQQSEIQQSKRNHEETKRKCELEKKRAELEKEQRLRKTAKQQKQKSKQLSERDSGELLVESTAEDRGVAKMSERETTKAGAKEEISRPNELCRLPLEILEQVLMRAFMQLYVRHYDTATSPSRYASITLASVSFQWWRSLFGWSQSRTSSWMKHQLQNNMYRFSLSSRHPEEQEEKAVLRKRLQLANKEKEKQREEFLKIIQELERHGRRESQFANDKLRSVRRELTEQKEENKILMKRLSMESGEHQRGLEAFSGKEAHAAGQQKATASSAEHYHPIDWSTVEPRVVHRLSTDAEVKGVTSLDDHLYVLHSREKDQLAVYDSNNFHLLHYLSPPGMSYYVDDITCSVFDKCLFISESGNKLIHRIGSYGRISFAHWPLMYKPNGISVTLANQLLVTCQEDSKLLLLESDGKCIEEISLNASIENVYHSQQLSNGDFVICHSYQALSILSFDGQTIRHKYHSNSFVPYHVCVIPDEFILVAYSGLAGGVVLLSRSLQVIRRFITKDDYGLTSPFRLSVDLLKRRIYVGEDAKQIVIFAL